MGIFEGPRLEPTQATIVLVISVLLPGFGHILASFLAQPFNLESMIVGIIIVSLHVILLFLGPIVIIIVDSVLLFLIFVIVSLLTVVTFGVGAVLYVFCLIPIFLFAFAPVGSLLALVTHIYSIIWAIKTYNLSKQEVPVSENTQQPQQPQQQVFQQEPQQLQQQEQVFQPQQQVFQQEQVFQPQQEFQPFQQPQMQEQVIQPQIQPQEQEFQPQQYLDQDGKSYVLGQNGETIY
jgi:ABC-type multidrug transport system fused ATPase/permease subunit